MRYKSISDINDKLGPQAAAQVEAQLVKINKGIISKNEAEAEIKKDLDGFINHKRKKYGNIPTERGGEKFDSKLEADVYDSLCAQFGKGGVIRQVSMPLSNGKRIRPDFMVIHSRNNDGTFVASFIDAKGMPTAAWTAKANHFEDKYGIEIKLRRKK